MKKLIFAILLCITLILLCSCGSNVETPSETPTEAPTEAATEAPTEPATEAPYDAATEEPTETPTEIPTETPYDVPTETPTDTQTETPIDEHQTEGPYDPPNKTPTEAPTETPPDPTVDVSDVRDDLLPFTVELAKTVYDTNDSYVTFHVLAKEPGCLAYNEGWTLYKLVNGEKTYVAANKQGIGIQLAPESEDEYVDSDQPFYFLALDDLGRSTLDVGKYCLELPSSSTDENGNPYIMAQLYFEVVEGDTPPSLIEIPPLLDDSDVRGDLIPFTVELTQNLYDTNDEKIHFHICGKEPGFFGRGDQWILYKIENGEKILIGERMVEIALECIPPSESEYYDKDEFLFISSICGPETKTLEVGSYCLEFPKQYPDENGIYQTCAAARMYFEVVEAAE